MFLPQVVCVLSIVGTLVGFRSPGFETQSSTGRIASQPRPFADLPLAAKRIQRPFLDPIEGATVLVGAVTGSSGSTIFGTGFIVERGGSAFVVTCRHVIMAASSTSLFAIPRPQKTKSPPGGYAVLRLGKPIYHPKDGTTDTYDIAVLEIIYSTKKRLRILGVVPIQLEASGWEQPNEGLALVAAGYPNDYAERELSAGKPERLRPLRVGGIVRYVPLEALTQNGFAGTLREGYFAQTADRPPGKGASGGAVYVDDGGHAVRVVGVLLGSADVQLPENGRMIGITGFVFASSLRIMETLPSREPPNPRMQPTRRRSPRAQLFLSSVAAPEWSPRFPVPCNRNGKRCAVQSVGARTIRWTRAEPAGLSSTTCP